MKDGSIKITLFDDLRSPRLNLKEPKLSYQYHDLSNCGTAALSLLTGLSPNFVQSKCTYPGKDGWAVSKMVQFLKQRNFKVIEVTKNSVTNVYWENRPIRTDHCLLVISHMNTTEASALVMHKGVTWHNLRTEDMDDLFFINKPTQNVYIVQHPKWK